MNMILLKEAPSDLAQYVKAPTDWPPEKCEKNLEGLIKNGVDGIEIESCPFEAIHRLEKVIFDNNYAVMFIKLPDSEAFAHFFLKKHSHKN